MASKLVESPKENTTVCQFCDAVLQNQPKFLVDHYQSHVSLVPERMDYNSMRMKRGHTSSDDNETEKPEKDKAANNSKKQKLKDGDDRNSDNDISYETPDIDRGADSENSDDFTPFMTKNQRRKLRRKTKNLHKAKQSSQSSKKHEGSEAVDISENPPVSPSEKDKSSQGSNLERNANADDHKNSSKDT